MGWLFGYYTRKELGDHLISGNGVTTVKHCWTGNNLWAVQENSVGQRFLALYLCKGSPTVKDDPFNWGYKDLDESAGPNYYNCPLSFLDMCPDPKVGYSTEWREKVKAYHAKRALRLKVGDRIMLDGKYECVVTESLGRSGYMVDAVTAHQMWRLPLRYMHRVTLAPQTSWKPVVQTDNTGQWYDNALRFATREEAEKSARDLASRWMLVRAYDVQETNDVVNYRITEDNRMESVQ